MSMSITLFFRLTNHTGQSDSDPATQLICIILMEHYSVCHLPPTLFIDWFRPVHSAPNPLLLTDSVTGQNTWIWRSMSGLGKKWKKQKWAAVIDRSMSTSLQLLKHFGGVATSGEGRPYFYYECSERDPHLLNVCESSQTLFDYNFHLVFISSSLTARLFQSFS